MNRAEWLNGISLIWSRGWLISPSLPVGDDRYLNLRSQKRPTGRNLGGHRLVRRSGSTSRGTVVLVFCLRMRRFPLNSSSCHIRGNEMNCLVSSDYITVLVSFTRASFLNMRRICHLVWFRTSFPKSTILPYFSLCKMSKNGNTSPLFKKNIWISLRLMFFALFKSKIAL